MNFERVNNVYLIGIGGIGMSSLARYFHILGKTVGGYDRTPSNITKSLANLGIEINFQDDLASIPKQFSDKTQKDEVLVIYTPAIPEDSSQLIYFQENQFLVYKQNLMRTSNDLSNHYH